MKNIIICCLLFISTSTNSQSNFTQTEKKLTGEGSRQWILKDTRRFLGNKCENGAIFTFLKANNQKQLQRKQCKEGTWAVDRTSWKLAKEGNLDTTLLLSNNEKYYIKFVQRKGKEFLRLRSFGKNNASETTDFYFYYEN